MLTARAEPEQRIEGLEIGVEDYVPKPFEPRELLLRLRNILRRGQAPALPLSDEIRMGTFVFHIGRGELKRNGETIKLTERERDLLAPVRAEARHADSASRTWRQRRSHGQRASDRCSD